MSLSIGHLLLVLLIVLLLFGARLPNVMRDLGKGIRNLREELAATTTRTKSRAPTPTRTRAGRLPCSMSASPNCC